MRKLKTQSALNYDQKKLRKVEIELGRINPLRDRVEALENAPSLVQADAILTLGQTISESTTISADNANLSVGTITIEAGATVTVEDGADWLIL